MLLFLCTFLSFTAQAANAPFTVYGRFYLDSVPYNGADITIYNSNTGESISSMEYSTLVTWSGTGGAGYYSGNIGNMPTNWTRGDVIYVNASYGGYSASSHFVIPDSGYIYEQDLNAGTPASGTGGTPWEGENQYHSIPTLQDIIKWIRAINLTDFFIVLVFGLVIVGIISLVSRPRPRRKRY